MSKSNGHIVWQVRGTDPSLAPHYFDARLIFHVRPAPFEMTLPNEALTLVVRAHADSAAVDVLIESFDEAGDSQSKFRTEGGCEVCIIVHSAAGSLLTSLPESSPPSAALTQSG